MIRCPEPGAGPDCSRGQSCAPGARSEPVPRLLRRPHRFRAQALLQPQPAAGAGRWVQAGRSGPGGADDGHHGVDLHRGAGLYFDLGKHACGGRGNLGIDFIGRDLEERLVLLHRVAGLFQPLGDGAFKNRLAHLGHDHFGEGGRRGVCGGVAAAGAGELVALGGSTVLAGVSAAGASAAGAAAAG